MQLTNSEQHFGLITRTFHWLTAALILGLVALGWYMVDLSYFDRWYNRSLNVHKALGMGVLALGVLTLIWRQISPSPEPLSSLKPWERAIGNAMHHVLLTLIIAIPLSGYLISTSAGKSIDVFGWFAIPALLKVDGGTRDIAILVHFWLAYGIAVLALMHAVAALKHHFIDRDKTLMRMLWP